LENAILVIDGNWII